MMRANDMPYRSTIPGLALCWLLAIPLLWLSMVRAPALHVDVGSWGDHAALTGVHGPEESSTENYRWTTAHAELALPNLSPAYRLLVLRAHGWRPQGPAPRVDIGLPGRAWATIQTSDQVRVYRLLLPNDATPASTRVSFTSQTYAPPDDPRLIGFAIDWVELRRLGATALPGAWQLLGQGVLLALLLLMIGYLCAPGPFAPLPERRQLLDTTSAGQRRWRVAIGAAILACLALLLLNLSEPLWLGLALLQWLILASGLLASLLIGGRLLERALQPWMAPAQARAAIALILAACALRLAGAIHPFFDTHDLPVHDRWMHAVTAGQLYLYSTPAELQNRMTFNPPAGYLLLAPFWLLLGDLRLTIQAGTALIDGLACLVLLGIARELRLTGRAAVWGLALYVALPINMTILWWGFAANQIAQGLWMLLLWLILRLARAPTRRNALLAGIVTAVCALTHIGALVLTVAILGLLALAGRVVLPRTAWRSIWVTFACAALLLVPIYFSAAAAPVLMQPPNPNTRTLAESFARGMQMRDLRLLFVRQAFTLGFTEPLLALVPAGLLALWHAPQRHTLQRSLLASWLAVCALFLVISVSLGFLTRYVYFAAPLFCLAGGCAVGWIWRRPGGRAVVVALVVLVAWVGAALWFSGVLLRDKPSLLPLTQ